MWNLKKVYEGTYLQYRKRLNRLRKQTYDYQRGQVVGEGWTRGFGIGIFALRYMELLAIGDMLYITEKYTQYSVIIYVGKESEREWICVHV